MMWMMLGCAALFLVLFFAGDILPTKVLFPLLIGLCVLAHLWMMVRGCGPSADEKKNEEKKGGHHGGCCS